MDETSGSSRDRRQDDSLAQNTFLRAGARRLAFRGRPRKQNVVIVGALIAGVATVLGAFITVVGSGGTTANQTVKQTLVHSVVVNAGREEQNKQPVNVAPNIIGIWPEQEPLNAGEMTFCVPPIFQLNASDDHPFGNHPVKALIKRTSEPKHSWRAVPPEDVQVTSQQEGRSLTARVDTQHRIYQDFAAFPYSSYKLRLDVVDQHGLIRAQTVGFCFAYRFSSATDRPFECWKGDISIGAEDDIYLFRSSPVDGFAYVKFTPSFQLDRDLVVEGRFTLVRVESGSLKNPAFDVAFYDDFRERIAIIFGETIDNITGETKYKIKMDGQGESFRGPALELDGESEHFFVVRLTRMNSASFRCSVAMEIGRPPGTDSWNYSRTFLVPGSIATAKLMTKLWNSGEMRVSHFVVAPAP